MYKMTHNFFRELQYYTLETIAFGITGKYEISEVVLKVCDTLRRLTILKEEDKNKNKKNVTFINEVIVQAETFSNDPHKRYCFDYVGVVLVDRFLFKIYPKYIESVESLLPKFKQVLRVIAFYNDKNKDTKNSLIYLNNGDSDNFILNRLALQLYLLKDYYENGLYDNQREIIETNGTGEILWDKTIHESVAFIKNNKPYYLELFTQSIEENDDNYFRRLQQCVLTLISKDLNDIGLLELLDINPVELTEENISDFGDYRYILYRLERELQAQFVTRKRSLLKTLIALFDNQKANKLEFSIRLYGTKNFKFIWQDVCEVVFANMLDKPIKDLPTVLPWQVGHAFFDRKKEKLKDIIEYPTWYKHGDVSIKAIGTLKPDLIVVFPYEDNYCFGIFDAKYYNIHLGRDISITNNEKNSLPGIEDITKQYLYQLAYMDFIKAQGYKYVVNMFLCPVSKSDKEFIEKDVVVNYGYVELQMLHDLTDENLENILVIKLVAEVCYDLYLNNEPIKDLQAFLPQINVGIINKKEENKSAFVANYQKYKYPKQIRMCYDERLIYEMLYDLVKDRFYLVPETEFTDHEQNIADTLESSEQKIRIELAKTAVVINERLSTNVNNALEETFVEKVIDECLRNSKSLYDLFEGKNYRTIIESLKDMYLELYS